MSKHKPERWIFTTSPTNQLFIQSNIPGKNKRGEATSLVATITLNAITDRRHLNARLLSAAPELLLVVKKFLKRFEHEIGSTHYEEVRALIAYAEGD